MMPSNSGSPFCNLRMRLRRISSLTDTDCQPEAQSSPRVRGRSMGVPKEEGISPGMAIRGWLDYCRGRVTEGLAMRLYPQGRWKRRLWWLTAIAMIVGAWWLYAIVTERPTNLATFCNLKQNMTRAEAEILLRGPANRSRELKPPCRLGETVPYKSDDEIIPGTLQSYSFSINRSPLKLGELHFAGPSMGIPRGDERLMVLVSEWEGSEGRISIS